MKLLLLPLILLQTVTFAPQQKSNNDSGNYQYSPPSQNQKISVKQAYYGPSWGKYKSLATGIRTFCGDNSNYCEVFCPGSGGFGNTKQCRVVYSCGETITKSSDAKSGEVIILDCRPQRQ